MTEKEPEPSCSNVVIVRRRELFTPEDNLVMMVESEIHSELSYCENPHEPAEVTEYFANEAP